MIEIPRLVPNDYDINAEVFGPIDGEYTGNPPVISLISEFVAQMNTPIADLSPKGKLDWYLMPSKCF